MNLNKLAENLGIEEDEFSELVGLFLETSASDLSKLQSATAGRDGQKAADAAHSIKGAAVNLGLTEIYDMAKQMETDARENRLTEVTEGIGALKQQLDCIAKSLAGRRQ